MDERQLRGAIANLFKSQRLAVLATHCEGHPYSSLVAFDTTDDLSQIVFVTGRATRKYANIEADARVSMLIDNRSNEAADFRDAMAVTATGRARSSSEEERAELLAAYLEKHPSLRDFAQSPSCELVVVDVEVYYAVSRFQQVVELHLAP